MNEILRDMSMYWVQYLSLRHSWATPNSLTQWRTWSTSKSFSMALEREVQMPVRTYCSRARRMMMSRN